MKIWPAIGAITALVAGGLVDASTSIPSTRRDKAGSFSTFAREIGLNESVGQTLGQRYSLTIQPSAVLELSCLVARLALGEAQVDTSPLNQTTVNINW